MRNELMKKALLAMYKVVSPSMLLCQAEANAIFAYQFAGAVTGIVEGCFLTLTGKAGRAVYPSNLTGPVDAASHQQIGRIPKNVVTTLLPLVVVGDDRGGKTTRVSFRIGKTTIVYRLLGRRDVPRQTLGSDLHLVQRCLSDGRTLVLQVWDTGGRHSAGLLGRDFFQNACGVLLVFDASSPSATDSLDWWSAIFWNQETVGPERRMPLVALGVVPEHAAHLYCQAALPGWNAAAAWCDRQGRQACFLLPPMCVVSATRPLQQNPPAQSEQQSSVRSEMETPAHPDTLCPTVPPRGPQGNPLPTSHPDPALSRESLSGSSSASLQEPARRPEPSKEAENYISPARWAEGSEGAIEAQPTGDAQHHGLPDVEGPSSSPLEQIHDGHVAVRTPEAEAEARLPGFLLHDAVIGEAFHCLAERALHWHDACPWQVQPMTQEEAALATTLGFHAFDPATETFVPVAVPTVSFGQPDANHQDACPVTPPQPPRFLGVRKWASVEQSEVAGESLPAKASTGSGKYPRDSAQALSVSPGDWRIRAGTPGAAVP